MLARYFGVRRDADRRFVCANCGFVVAHNEWNYVGGVDDAPIHVDVYRCGCGNRFVLVFDENEVNENGNNEDIGSGDDRI